MAPKPKRSRGVAARLTAKVGPLPVWAWAALILAAYFLYTRLHGSSSASATSSATPATPTTDTSGSDTGALGSSSTPDLSGISAALDQQTSTLDQLTQLLTMPSYGTLGDVTGLGAEVPSDLGYGYGPAATPTPTPTPSPTPSPTAAHPAAHPTQTTAGVLKWGGLTFTTKAAFNSWAASHGTTATKELSNHPQARAIYSTLR